MPVAYTRAGSTGRSLDSAATSSEMKCTSSTPVRPGSPQQPPPTAHAWLMPSGYATTKCPLSASASQPYHCSAWLPLPNPPCSITTSGTGADGGNDAGRYTWYVRATPSTVIVRVDEPAATGPWSAPPPWSALPGSPPFGARRAAVQPASRASTASRGSAIRGNFMAEASGHIVSGR